MDKKMLKNLNKSEYLFDAKKNFFDLAIVKSFFLIILGISFFCAVIIFLNSKLSFDFSYSGFNNFIEIFKVPIGVLALNIPIIAVLGAFHKSEQTRLQIELSNGQNNFSNYYKHIEEFKKLISSNYRNKERCDIELLHKKIFPDAVNGDYGLSSAVRFKLEGLIFEHFKLLTRSVGSDCENSGISNFLINYLEGSNWHAVYDFLYYKGYQEFSVSLDTQIPDIEEVKIFAEFIKESVRMLSLVKLIVYFDHTSDGTSNLEQFVALLDPDKFESDINKFLNKLIINGDDEPYINTRKYNESAIAENFNGIIISNMNISALNKDLSD